MARKKTIRTGPAKPIRAEDVVEKPVALTLKIDSATYLRLSVLRAKQRRTAQDILEVALKEYLKREQA